MTDSTVFDTLRGNCGKLAYFGVKTAPEPTDSALVFSVFPIGSLSERFAFLLPRFRPSQKIDTISSKCLLYF